MRRYAWLLALGLVACGPGESEMLSVVEPEVPAGWTLMESQDGVFSVAVPPEWDTPKNIMLRESQSETGNASEVASMALDMAVAEQDILALPDTVGFPGEDPDGLMNLSNPVTMVPGGETADAYAGSQLSLAPVREGRALPGEFRTIMVAHTIERGGATLDDAQEVQAKAASGFGEGETFDLAVGPVRRFMKSGRNRTGDEVHELVYYFAHDHKLIRLRFVSMKPVSSWQPAAEGIVETFRVR